jgi:hypothetical protein
LGLICTLTAIGHCGILDTVDGVRQGVKLANNLNSGYDYMGDIFREVKDQVGKAVNTAMSDDSPVGGIVDTIGEVGQIVGVKLVNNLMKDDSPPEGLNLGDIVGAVGQGVKLVNNLMKDDSLPEGLDLGDIVGWPFGQDVTLVNNLMKDDSPPATTTENPAPEQPQNSPQSLLLGKLQVQLIQPQNPAPLQLLGKFKVGQGVKLANNLNSGYDYIGDILGKAVNTAMSDDSPVGGNVDTIGEVAKAGGEIEGFDLAGALGEGFKLVNNLMKTDSPPATTTEIPAPAQPQNSPPPQSLLLGKLQVQLIQPQNPAPLLLLGKFKLQLVRA